MECTGNFFHLHVMSQGPLFVVRFLDVMLRSGVWGASPSYASFPHLSPEAAEKEGSGGRQMDGQMSAFLLICPTWISLAVLPERGRSAHGSRDAPVGRSLCWLLPWLTCLSPPPHPRLSLFLPLISGVQLESRAQGGKPIPGESWAGLVSTEEGPLSFSSVFCLCRGSDWRPTISTHPCSSQQEVSASPAGLLWGWAGPHLLARAATWLPGLPRPQPRLDSCSPAGSTSQLPGPSAHRCPHPHLAHYLPEPLFAGLCKTSP